ncbi:phage antirepressor N-terminal domain-containing protein [Morganella morganii]|uniref:Phage antirepressor N-terminal domain-containing protein n=1 Tax=Morganella morganii TaxID=582 RepID=A0A9Q4CR38_MORMO|nr:phage antirepressor N-terminal domain-containing protein [Morganella morganii]MCY0791913.1 phage antirepressor N-terminal domain-containing protein [Morganella morganii]
MNKCNIFPFDFHEDKLYLIEHKSEPYVAMKHIVEGMGLDWKAQYRRLKQRFNICMVEMTMQIPGDDQRRLVSCLALRKLPGWLMTINANKVKPEVRDKVIQYQQECDDALYDYWTKGVAINIRLKGKDWLMIFEQFHKVLTEISRQREYGIRKVLYEDLKSLADILGRDVPELDDISGREPEIGDPCRDSDALFEFWDLFDMLETPATPRLNHSPDPEIIAIEPFEFSQFCKNKDLEFPGINVVRREMHTRSRYPFEGHREIESAITGKLIKCWTFRR